MVQRIISYSALQLEYTLQNPTQFLKRLNM